MKTYALLGAALGFFLGMALMNYSCGPMFQTREGVVLHVLASLFVSVVGLLIGWIFDKR